MKKVVLSMVLSLVALCAVAQESEEKRSGWNMFAQGGLLYSINENTHEASFGDLVTGGGVIGVGYDFSRVFGVRAQLGWSKNVSGTNVKETGRPFTLYKFNDVTVSADAVFNISQYCIRYEEPRDLKFEFKGYVGLGCAFASDYDSMKQSWYGIKDKGQNVFNMRFGFIGDYHVSKAVSLYGDLGLGAYSDSFNGVNAGAELDLRLSLMMGVAYHF